MESILLVSNRMNLTIVKKNLVLLNSVRGMAAIYVLCGHARLLLWEGFQGYLSHPENYSMLNKIFMYSFSIFRYGHEAVIFFFVLSGFVIHWSSSIRIDKKGGHFEIWEYLKKRITRLYPPFLVAILLTFVLDIIGEKYFHLPIYSPTTRYEFLNKHITANHELSTLFGNLLFLHTVYTPVWGTNGALWSLMYEWWFYILYIPVLFVFKKNKVVTSLSIILLWVINMKFGYGPLLFTKVFNYFLVWYLGMLLADFLLYHTLKKRELFGLFSLVLVCSGFFYQKEFGADTLIGIFISLLLLIILTTNAFSFLHFLSGLGSFSYSLYVVHVPVIRLISGFLMKNNDGYLPGHFGYFFLGVTIAIILGYTLHFISEVPFTKKKAD